MSNIVSIRVEKDELDFIKEYAATNGLTVSGLFKEAVLDFIEEDLNLDEERIMKARERLQTEKAYDHTEVWKRLGV